MTSHMRSRLRRQFQKLVDLGNRFAIPSLVQMAAKFKQDYMDSDQKKFFDAGAFGPVLKLLSDLITQLEEEQAAETSQHEWCENEKEGGVNAKTERETKIHELKETIEQ